MKIFYTKKIVLKTRTKSRGNVLNLKHFGPSYKIYVEQIPGVKKLLNVLQLPKVK